LWREEGGIGVLSPGPVLIPRKVLFRFRGSDGPIGLGIHGFRLRVFMVRERVKDEK
jgi:hypothetical protein